MHWRQHGALDPEGQMHLVNSWLLLGEPARALELATRFFRESPGSIDAEALMLRVRALDDLDGADSAWRQHLESPRAGRRAFRHYAEYLALTDRRARALEASFAGLACPAEDSVNLLASAARIALSVRGLDPVAFRARFSAAVQRELGAPTPAPKRPRRSGALRVGILGSSLHFHPIMGFISPLVRGLDRRRFSVRIYSAGSIRDGHQDALRNLSDQWLDVAALETPQLVERLRREDLDLLVELDNHTRENRLAALAQRVAPVQISLFGLNQTTGLEAIDYRITDEVVDPAGSESSYTEKLLRLTSCHLAYLPFEPVPRVGGAPSRHGGPVRMGLFNSWHKIGDDEISLWISLLRKHDRLQLVVAGFDDGVANLRLRRQLSAAGIAPERVEIHPFLEEHRFWSLVQSVDFALDSYPWGGGATSAAVLSLGVPLLTRIGPRPASRISASMLLALDMGRWIVPVEKDIAGRIAELVSDPAQLDSPRRGLQDAFAARFCEPEPYAAKMGSLLEEAGRA
ncbi:MAG: hypothetical protein JO035_02795 [Betaproteobacteria bacterium]|nr:hypothetical protein [Betaproteobacteria bacterium]